MDLSESNEIYIQIDRQNNNGQERGKIQKGEQGNAEHGCTLLGNDRIVKTFLPDKPQIILKGPPSLRDKLAPNVFKPPAKKTCCFPKPHRLLPMSGVFLEWKQEQKDEWFCLGQHFC